MMPLVSIIVPVYNAEAYLMPCVQSILAQTYSALEVILVNDGSADQSGKLCDTLAEQDGRICVIHQTNAGVSAARNAGLDAAHGEWIGFVDADDRILPTMIEAALHAASDCPLVMWDAITVTQSKKGRAPDTIPLLSESRILEKKDFYPDLLAQMAGAVWRCLYRRELLDGIRFPLGIKLSEDRLFNLAAMGKASNVSYLKQGLYEHYMIEGSACHRYHGDIFEKNLCAMEIAREIIAQYWSDDYLPVYMRMFVIGGALQAIREIASKEFVGDNRCCEIKRISSSFEIHHYFDTISPSGIVEKLLRCERNGWLLLCARMQNIKNRIESFFMRSK